MTIRIRVTQRRAVLVQCLRTAGLNSRAKTATVMTVCRRLLEYSEDTSARSYSSQRPLRTSVRVQVRWDPRTTPSPRKKEISAHKAAMVTAAGEAVGPITGLLPVSYTHLTLPTNREV